MTAANSYVIGKSELGGQACPHHPWPTQPGCETRLGPWPRLQSSLELVGTWYYHSPSGVASLEKVIMVDPIGDNSEVPNTKDQEGNAEIARLGKQLPAFLDMSENSLDFKTYKQTYQDH